MKCYYVYLLGRKDKHIADGYIAKDFNEPPFTQYPEVREKHYSIYEPHHLNRNKLILTINKVAETLLQ